MDSRSEAVTSRTEATVPSFSTSRGLSIWSPAGSGGVISRRSGTSARDRQIRRDEVAFRMAHRQYRTTRGAHHTFGDASQQQLRKPAAAMRADHDEIDVGLGRVV